MLKFDRDPYFGETIEVLKICNQKLATENPDGELEFYRKYGTFLKTDGEQGTLRRRACCVLVGSGFL